MNRSRIFLTGSTGFVGSHTLRAFLRSGCEVSILVREKSNPWRIRDLLGDVRLVPGDLTASDAITHHLRQHPADAIVHLAWEGVTNDSRNDLAQLKNIQATQNLLQLGIRNGCGNWIGLGSQAEYGVHSGVISETAVTSPTTVYGVAKLATNLLIEKQCKENAVRFGWLRLFSSYGPQNDPSWMLPYLTRKLLNGERPALTGGDQLWDFIYVTDVAEAVVSLTLHQTANGVFNLGSGDARRLRDIIEIVRDAIDPALPLGFGEVPYRPDQVMHLEADITRLKSATGWSPRVSLEDGLRFSVEAERVSLGS